MNFSWDPTQPLVWTPHDAGHLRLLSTFHYVYAGMTAFFGCLPILHLIVGIAALAGAFPVQSAQEAAEAQLLGIIFTAGGATAIAVFWMCAALFAWAGRRLAQRRSYRFCFLVACVLCLFMPLGTVLGVFTILFLMQPRVKAAFDQPQPSGLSSM